MPSFTAARLIAVARRLAPWLVGPVVLILRGHTLELAGPSPCPGFLELIAIGVLRAQPDLRIGAVFDVLQVTVIAAALAAFVELLCRYTRSLAIALATAAAVGLSAFVPAVLAPPWEAAAFGLCAAAAAIVTSPLLRRRSLIAGLGGLAIAAILVPVWLLTSSLPAATASACAVPSVSMTRAAGIAGATVSWLGPLALALGALGVFSEYQRGAWRRSALGALIAVAVATLGSGTALSSAVVAAPLAVLLWWLAGLGLDELVAAVGRRPSARIVGALLLLLVPALAASRRATEERDDWVRPRGHDQQTLRRMTTVLNLVPQEATFVEEDATVDVLLRAAVFGGRRRAKPVSIVAAAPDAVAHAMASHAVYAFPQRQDDLSMRGFIVDQDAAARLSADASRQFEGIAAITGRRLCQDVGRRSADFSGASDRIALSADSEAARGPAVIYLGGATAGAPGPDGWSPRMLRGFGYFTFDQLTPAGTERLRVEAREAGLPLTHPLLAETFVVRLNLHRSPRAPLTLPVRLGASFPIGVVKLEDGADGVGRLTVCDAPPVAISALPPRD